MREEDFENLYQVASDPLIWEQHPERTRYKREVFRESFFKTAMESKAAFLILKADSEEVIGSSRYYDFGTAESLIAIGYTFLARQYWGHTYNSELKKIMLEYAFQFVDTVVFHIGVNNIRSQKAIGKIGASFLKKAEFTKPDGTSYQEFVYGITKEKFASAFSN